MRKKSFRSVKIKSVPESEIASKLKLWASSTALKQPEIMKVGYFGSYARGDYTPSSDLDVLIIVCDSDKPPHRRSIDYSIDHFPVGCEIFVYTTSELYETKNGWFKTIQSDVKWVFLKELSHL